MSAKKLVIATNHPRFFLNHRLGLAERARAEGYRVIGLFPDGKETLDVQAKGFETVTLPLSRKGTSPLAELNSLWSFYKQLVKIQPDIYHGFTIKPVIYGALAARLAKVPQIYGTITGLGYVFIETGWKAKLLRSLVCRLYQFSFHHKNIKIVFQNLDDQSLFLENKLIQQDKTLIIPGTGVDTKKFEPNTTNNKVPHILVATRILRHKGIGDLVEACKILYQKNLQFRLTIAGQVDPQNPASFTQQELEIWNQLPFCDCIGYQKDIVKVYAYADIVALPSFREGFPLGLVEAAACGKPIVATDVPGCRDIVVHGYNGFLSKVKNVTSLAAYLEKLIVSESLRKKMGRNSRALAEQKYEAQHVLGQYMSLYRSPEELLLSLDKTS